MQLKKIELENKTKIKKILKESRIRNYFERPKKRLYKKDEYLCKGSQRNCKHIRINYSDQGCLWIGLNGF